MRTLCGFVQTRHGIATGSLASVQKLIAQQMGLPPLYPGTLNVSLPEIYLVTPDAIIAQEEYNGLETLNLKRCKIRGLHCCIMRPDSHETPANEGAKVIEIMSQYRLRDHFKLSDGERIEVEVEGDEIWWGS